MGHSHKMNELQPHIGHHLMATIAVEELILDWDKEKKQPVWSVDAAEKLKQAVLDYVEE